ncbi:hypothetical protein [Trinickia mobilis]|uniref:hypothetical protein n=1 Tax=Trinickia mobilis TaxID=2816356 RepID=UPI001A8FFC0B|nr:hypothetical protein [Trinickia mobilis]
MPDSSIDFMLALVVFVCAAFLAATRYQTEHPLNDLRRWLGAHHPHWMHRRH